MELRELLVGMVRGEASDLFLRSGRPISLRVHGAVRWIMAPGGSEKMVAEPAFVDATVAETLNEGERRRFEATGEADAAYQIDGLGRFRINVFRQRGTTAMVFRHIPLEIPDFAALRLPAEPLRKLCERSRGLILVTGVAGSGKSTCLASMIEHINKELPRHVVTIEDPIEFVYEDKQSTVDQREVGLDTESFSSALRHVLRQSPDVILIGEMRDRETMETALNAAETGHLVFSTLHTGTAAQTLERLVAYFPPHQHGLIRTQLATNLAGVISLRLLVRRDRKGRVPAVELLVATARTRELIQEGKARDLTEAMREGDYYGMRTFDQALIGLVEQSVVSEAEALAAADNPDEFKLRRRGFQSGAGTRFKAT